MKSFGNTTAIEGQDRKAKQGNIAELIRKIATHIIIMQASGSNKQKSYLEHINILCVLDNRNGAAFVFRNEKRAFAIPIPGYGRCGIRGWGKYTKHTKLDKIQKIQGL